MTVGVVGAGITGLAVTHYLVDRGVDVETYESTDAPGGVIQSERVDGRLLEYGPQRIRCAPPVAELIEDLSLGDAVLEADGSLPLYVYADGALREVPRSVSAFLRTDLLSCRGKLRVLAEPLTDPVAPEERAADAFTRKFGDEAYRNVIEPLFGGIYASDPAEMPAEHALPRLIAMERREGSLLRGGLRRVGARQDTPPPVTFRDGLGTLPRALLARHRSRVHLGTPVETIRERPDGRYTIVTTGGTTAVDAVVLTTPAAATATMLQELDGAEAEPLRGLRYNSLVLVHLHANADLDGFGYQVRRDEPLRTRGVTWNDSLFDRDGVYTAFLGGMADEDAVDDTAEELGTTARREFRAVTDVDSDVLSVTKLPRVLPAHDSSWAALEDVELPDDVVLASNYTGRLGVPSRIRAAERVAEQLAPEGYGHGR